MKTFFRLLVIMLVLQACASVRFSTEAEKRQAANETRARLGLPPEQEGGQR